MCNLCSICKLGFLEMRCRISRGKSADLSTQCEMACQRAFEAIEIKVEVLPLPSPQEGTPLMSSILLFVFYFYLFHVYISIGMSHTLCSQEFDTEAEAKSCAKEWLHQKIFPASRKRKRKGKGFPTGVWSCVVVCGRVWSCV